MQIFTIRLLVAFFAFVISVGVVAEWKNYQYKVAAKSELLQLTNLYHEAQKISDEKTLNQILADDLTVYRRGKLLVDSKAQFLANIRNVKEQSIFEFISADDIYVQIEGNQANISCKLFAKFRHQDGTLIEHRALYNYFYEKRGEDWQLVSIRFEI